MSTLSDVLAEHSVLSGAAVAHLQTVVSEWQLLADLSFSDLLLWVPTEGDLLICVAQARPTRPLPTIAALRRARHRPWPLAPDGPEIRGRGRGSSSRPSS